MKILSIRVKKQLAIERMRSRFVTIKTTLEGRASGRRIPTLRNILMTACWRVSLDYLSFTGNFSNAIDINVCIMSQGITGNSVLHAFRSDLLLLRAILLYMKSPKLEL